MHLTPLSEHVDQATDARQPRRPARGLRLCAILLLAVAALLGGAATPATARPAPGGPSQHLFWRVTGHGSNYYFGSTWHNCAAFSSRSYSYNLGCSFAESVASSVTGSVTASVKAISANVGYSVTWTKTVTATASFPIARHTSGYIQYHQKYRGTPVYQTGYKCWSATYNPRYCVASYHRTAYAHKWLGTEFRKI